MAGFSGLREVDFEALATRSARRGSPTYNDKQAELLVPARVSLDDLEYVAFRSQASLDEAVRCCAGVGRRHPFRVQPDLFHFPNGKGNHFGSISAELINRHRYSSGSSRLLTEEQLFSVLAGPGLKGGIAKLERGISLVQTIATLKHVTMTVKWTGPTPGKRIVISGLSTAHLPFLDKGISAVCTSLGPELLVPGQWKVKCTLTLDDISKQIPIDQFTIPFTIQ